MRRPANWLVSILEGAQASQGTGRHDPGYFHPSDFSSDCDAFLAFRYLGAPTVSVIEPKTQRIFDYGNVRESYLREYLRVAGISLITKPEERLIEIPHLHIRGELDDWVVNPLTKERFIIDYKTMRLDRFEKLEAVVPGHRLQVHPYQFAKETYQAFVLYECKDDQRYKAMPASFDGKIWQEQFVERVERIMTGLDHNVVYRNPVNCSSCPFRNICPINNIAELKEKSNLF